MKIYSPVGKFAERAKIADFKQSLLHLAPPSGVTPLEFRQDL